ncbi:DMT family transporter [Pseudoalteromonas luteoviolacea]|uniref:DMT family transporter n=1 Tax=Pseudoalteromonas luteoviolacea TaxID=43657 RepID=UPI001B38293E|nr:DMT family transporter [Pseudoalteromonas luteoviolacea]MBQ4838015.1 DMT family transporter [Pseudoalteromonas luteoviolacea]
MTTSINHTMNIKIWTMLILLSMLWGGSFFFVGVAVSSLPSLTIVTLRVGIAALVLWGMVIALGERPPNSLKVWGAFFFMGLLNNVIPFVLIVWGQTQIASGLASILNAATPIFAVIVAGVLLPDERPSFMKLVGVMLGFCGVVVMIGMPALEGSGRLLAQLAVVAAALSYAFAGVYGRRFKSMGINPLSTAAGQVTASTLIMIPLTLLLEGAVDFRSISVITWGAVAGLAIGSTAVAYVLYFKVLELAGATNVLLVTLLVPVSAVFLGALFLNESLETIHFIGMGLIALGLSAIDGRLWRQLRLTGA